MSDRTPHTPYTPRAGVPAPHVTLPATALAALWLLLMGTLWVTTALRGDEVSATAGERAAAPRVAILVPYAVDALGELPGGEFHLVAAVAPTGRELPPGVTDLGSPHHPNYEVLARVAPDLVVGDRRLHGALRERLRRSGAEVLLLSGASVEATFGGLQRLGDRLGHGEAMALRLDAARRTLHDLRLERPVEVLPLFGAPGSFLAVTGSTWLGDLLHRLGFANPVTAGAGRETFPGYVQLSDEVLVTLDPERVLLVTHGDAAAVREAFRRQTAGGGPWSRLGERATVLDPELFGDNPGLRIPDAARRLVALHGGRAAAGQGARAAGGGP